MKRFVIRNIFALSLFVVTVGVILSLDINRVILLILLISLGVFVVSSSIKAFVDLRKKRVIFDPVINFDEQRIECKHTGKILYQFTINEWINLSLDEKIDMIRWFKFA